MASHNRNKKKTTASGETGTSMEMESEAAVDNIAEYSILFNQTETCVRSNCIAKYEKDYNVQTTIHLDLLICTERNADIQLIKFTV